MGTKVHYKSYFPGYCFMRDLNEDADIGSWPVYHEDKMMTGRSYGNSFVSRPATDGYSQYDKEGLRKTMLRHEATFKDQVAELHRVYRIQRNLMEELRRKDVHIYSTPLNASSSMFHSDSSRMLSEGARNIWDISGKPSCSGPSFSGPHNMQSPSELIRIGNMQGHTVSNGSLKDHRQLETDSKKLATRMFDLQLPADQYIDNEEGEHTEERAMVGAHIENNVNLSTGYGRNLKCPEDSSNSDLSFRNKLNLADLNHPIPVEEVASSSSVGNFASSSSVGNFLGPFACSSDTQVQNFNKQNSGSLVLPREFYQSTSRGIFNGSHQYVWDLENTAGRPECPPYNLENGQSRSTLNSLSHGFGPEGFPSTSKQTLSEHRSTQLPSFLMDDQRKRGLLRQSENCATELAQRSDRLAKHNFLTPGLVPDIRSTYPVIPDVAELRPSPSFLKEPTSGLIQGSVQPHHCFNTPRQLSTTSEMSMQKTGMTEVQWHFNGPQKLNTSLTGGMSCTNGFLHRAQNKSSASEDRYPSVGIDYRNCSRDNASSSTYFDNCSTPKYFKASECTDVKSAKDLNLNVAIPNGFKEAMVPQQQNLIVDGERKNKDPVRGLPWLKMKPTCNDGPRRVLNEKGVCQSQSYIYQSIPNFAKEKVLAPDSIQDSSSTSIACDAEDQRTQKNESLSGKKILGFPIIDGTRASENHSSFGIYSKSLHSLSEVEFLSNGDKPGAVRIDSTCDPAILASCQKLSSENEAAGKELDKGISNVKYHFNLNSCADEEEPCTYSVSRENRTIDIDLEAPALPETLENAPSEEESQADQIKLSSQSSQVGSEDLSEELVKNVAEAIMIISSSEFSFRAEDVTKHPSGIPLSDSLRWFADIVSSHRESLDGKNEVISKENCGGRESSSSCSDYFETMTLKLTETKLDECLSKPWLPEPQNEEDACVSSVVATRRRRGHAKRGRQRRDFQRDILPGLASLSRHEVTEDLQVIGGLMRATGHPWQTGVTRRSATRNGWARGRKRTRNVAPAVVEPVVCSPPQQQANNNDMGLEERSLTGWGKTTRRPRRQRFAAGNISIPLTQV